MKKLLIVSAILLLGALFTQNVFAVLNPGSFAFVENISALVVGSQVTVDVSGKLSVLAEAPECFEDPVSGYTPRYKWHSRSADSTSPASSLVITAGPAGMLNQTIPVTITPASPSVGDCDTKAENYTFSGSRVFSSVPAGTHTLTAQVTDNLNKTSSKSTSFTVASTPFSVTATAGTGGTVSSPCSVAGGNTSATCSNVKALDGYIINTTLSGVSFSPTSCAVAGSFSGTSTSASYTTGQVDANCNVNFSFTAAPTVTGYHDGASGTVASTSCKAYGWAALTDKTAGLTIGILSDGVPVYYGNAGGYSGALTEVCNGGNCYFDVDLSDRISPDVNHSITVQAQNPNTSAWTTLGNSPKTLNCTAVPPPPPTDACGTSSGSTPMLTEPTTNPAACNPGTYANSPADTTTLGAQAWNWSCGVVTSCTAPKYGCRVTTDSNYSLPQYGANGPNNNYGCAGTCANGGTDYSTCTPPAGMSGTLTTPSCTIASGASTCTTTLSWDVTNPEIVGGSSVTSSYPSAGTVVSPPVSTGTADVGTKTSVTIPYSSRTFYLYNNGVQLNTGTASATCTAGTSWNGSICVPGMSGTLTPTTNTFCVIASGESECTLNMDWSIENPVATPTAITANGMSNINVSNSLTPASQSGTQSVPVPYNTRTFYLYNNAVLLAQSTVSSSCEEGTGWDGSVCVVGGGTPESSEPPVVIIWATPTSGTVNQVNPVIGWEVTNAPTSCTATGDWSGTRAAGGTQFQGVLDTVKTYTYTLTCENVYGISDPASANVVVQSSASTLTINASPNSIYAGASSTLTWVGAGTCTGTNFDNGGLASGNLTVSPIVTTTYTLTCDGVPVSTTIRVLKKPTFIED